jgi:hypothetical protein
MTAQANYNWKKCEVCEEDFLGHEAKWCLVCINKCYSSKLSKDEWVAKQHRKKEGTFTLPKSSD